MRTIQTTDVQEKAMSYIALDPQEWIQNAWDNRARQAMDEIVQEHSDKQPKKMTVAEKEEIVKKANIKTAAQRNQEVLEKLKQ